MTHVVLLSVTKGGHGLAHVDPDLAAELGVNVCATIPQSVLEELITSGGSPVDLLLLLQRLRGLGEVLESRTHEIFLAYREECYQNSTRAVNEQLVAAAREDHPFRALEGWPTSPDPTPLVGMAAHITIAFFKSRDQPIPGRSGTLPVVTASDIGGEFGVYNDLTGPDKTPGESRKLSLDRGFVRAS